MKRNSKKLVLSRETVRCLDDADLKRVGGGDITPGCTAHCTNTNCSIIVCKKRVLMAG